MVGRKISKGDFFFLSRVLSFPQYFFFMDLKLTPSSTPYLFLYACRMERGHEEVLTSQVGCRKGTPQETPTSSSLVAAMSAEELRL